MAHTLNQDGKDLLFNDARTYNNWQKRPVDETLLKDLYDLLKMAPTSANCSPGRFTFLTTEDAKKRLKPHLAEGNVDKTMDAPVVALIANDMEFYEHLPKLFPHTDAKSWFIGKPDYIQDTAERNGTLQGGYLIMAARALGLDCGPMSGFDADGINKEFYKDTPYKINFICNLGYGDPEGLFDRAPRFGFDEACEIV